MHQYPNHLSDYALLAKEFLQKEFLEEKEGKNDQFNLVTQTNAFHSAFDLKKLDPSEERRLKEMLESNWVHGEELASSQANHFRN